jgi:membrane protease YdiL (CAAX protease family)
LQGIDDIIGPFWILAALAGIVIAAGSVALLWATGGPVRRLPHRGQLALAFGAWILESLLLLIAFSLIAAPVALSLPAPGDLLAMLPLQAIQTLAVLVALVALTLTWRVPGFPAVGLITAGPGARYALRDTAIGLVLGPVAVGVFLVAGLIGGWDRITGVAPVPEMIGSLVLGVVFFLFVAVFEEVSTRGCLFALLARVLGIPAAAAISAVTFGLLHGLNPGATPVALLGVGLAGVVFLFALYRTGALWLPIAFHLSWDWAETSLYGYPDSGIPPSAALRLAIDPNAPAWATGGEFGPEASIFVLVALALAAGAIWLYTRGRPGRAILFPAGAPEHQPPYQPAPLPEQGERPRYI